MDPFLLIDRAREHKLSDTQFRLLMKVRDGATCQSRIAESLKKSTAAIGTAVKSLVTRELLSKARRGEDERQVKLALTETGKDLLATIEAEPAPR